MAVSENQKVYYDTELGKLLQDHKIKGFFFKRFGWFKKKFEIEESIECFDYDRIYEKYSEFFKDEKYSALHLKKIIFLIEGKIDKDYEYKPQISEFLNNSMTMIACILTYLGIYVGLLPNQILALKTFPNVDPVIVKFVIFCFMIIMSFIIFFKEITKFSDELSLKKKKFLFSKKKYSLILNCLYDEIGRREKSEKIRKLILNL